MKTLFKILIIVSILCNAAQSSIAQEDTLSSSNLYRNAASKTTQAPTSKTRRISAKDADTIGDLLQDLKELYTAGKYDKVLQLSQELQDSHNLSKEQNLQRLKLTISAYKDFGYLREADSAAKVYLQKDPFFRADDKAKTKDDPVTFLEVLGNYYTMPKYSLWLSAGIMRNRVVLDTVQLIVDTVSHRPDYKAEGYTLQLGLEYRPLRILTVSFAPTINICSITRITQRSAITSFRYEEDYTTISLPLCVEATLPTHRNAIAPSIYAGAQMKYIIGAEYTAYENSIGEYVNIPNTIGNASAHNRPNYSILGGARLYIPRGRISYFGEVGVAYDLIPFFDSGQRYKNHTLLYDLLYIPDKFRMLEISYRIGIKINLQYKTIAKFNYGY